MKIAVPVVEKTVESTISLSFGRAPYFLIYDADNKESFFWKTALLKVLEAQVLKHLK